MQIQIQRYEELSEKLRADAGDPVAVKAFELIEKGEIDEAEQLYERSVADSEKALVGRMVTLAQIKELQWKRSDAIAVLQRPVSIFPDSPDAVLALANTLTADSSDKDGNLLAEESLKKFIARARPSIAQTSNAEKLLFANALTVLGIAMHNQGGEKRKQSIEPRLEAIALYRQVCAKGDNQCLLDFARPVSSVAVLYRQDSREQDGISLLSDSIGFLRDKNAPGSSFMRMLMQLVETLQRVGDQRRALLIIQTGLNAVATGEGRGYDLYRLELHGAAIASKLTLDPNNDATREFDGAWPIFLKLSTQQLSPAEFQAAKDFVVYTCGYWESFGAFTWQPVDDMIRTYQSLAGSNLEAKRQLRDMRACLSNYFLNTDKFDLFIKERADHGPLLNAQQFESAEMALVYKLAGRRQDSLAEYKRFDSLAQSLSSSQCDADCRQSISEGYQAWIGLCDEEQDAGCKTQPASRLANLPKPKTVAPEFMHFVILPKPW
jgi:hypothetical protein